ncbi:hypothetical protein VQ056_04475 [Paenibacillus sp. JTLBN-2024]
MVESKLLTDIRISLEICSEAPGYDENWPSDILFSVGGVEVCKWTSPGDFGSVRGKLTPLWWDQGSTQHGLLKTLWINADGTFMDGVRLSRVTTTGHSHRPRQTDPLPDQFARRCQISRRRQPVRQKLRQL